MSKDIKRYDCLLISPSDVEPERKALSELINSWNAQIGKLLNVYLNLEKYETHSVPDLKGEPQEVINEQLVNDSDFGIALFWSKIGTPTKSYESGSIEEIERLKKQGKRVMMYFCDRPIPPAQLQDLTQYEKLIVIKNKYMKMGLVDNYMEIYELKETVLLHLTNIIINYLMKDRGIRIESDEPQADLTKPNIKVYVQAAFAMHPIKGLLNVISLNVQNHSSQIFYPRSFRIKLKNNMDMLILQDFLTEEYQKKRALNPGESYSVNVDPNYLIDEFDKDNIITAILTDDIDRTFEIDPKQFYGVLKAVIGLIRDKKKKDHE